MSRTAIPWSVFNERQQISSHDSFSRAALVAVLTKFTGLGARALRLVVESRVSLKSVGIQSITLGPLTDQQVLQVANAIPWQLAQSEKYLVDVAKGNPGLAIAVAKYTKFQNPTPLESSTDARFAPWFTFVDLSLDDLDAAVELARTERLGAQAVFMVTQAVRKMLEGVLLALGEKDVSRFASNAAIANRLRGWDRRNPSRWDYLQEYAEFAAEELDRWAGGRGEKTRFPAGTPQTLDELMEQHPGASFHPMITYAAVKHAATLTNWGQYWFRVFAESFVKQQGVQLCAYCDPGGQHARRPMYLCGQCLKWVCESCSCLVDVSDDSEASRHMDRVCDHCNDAYQLRDSSRAVADVLELTPTE